MGRKFGGCSPLGEEELGPHLIQCGQVRALRARQVSSWSIQHTRQDRTDRTTVR